MYWVHEYFSWLMTFFALSLFVDVAIYSRAATRIVLRSARVAAGPNVMMIPAAIGASLASFIFVMLVL